MGTDRIASDVWGIPSVTGDGEGGGRSVRSSRRASAILGIESGIESGRAAGLLHAARH